MGGNPNPMNNPNQHLNVDAVEDGDLVGVVLLVPECFRVVCVVLFMFFFLKSRCRPWNVEWFGTGFWRG